MYNSKTLAVRLGTHVCNSQSYNWSLEATSAAKRKGGITLAGEQLIL